MPQDMETVRGGQGDSEVGRGRRRRGRVGGGNYRADKTLDIVIHQRELTHFLTSNSSLGFFGSS